ncbi:MAG: HAD-IIIC family phosphatase [Angelakisella sp.]
MLQYPFDGAQLLRKNKALVAQLRQNPPAIRKKIAILGGSTTSHIRDLLELFLLDNGIDPTFYQCEYGQYYQEVLFHNQQLREFAPDFIYLHTTNRNIEGYPIITDTPDMVQQKLQAEFARFRSLWERIAADYGCTVIQNNFELPATRLLGNRDSCDHRGKTAFITRLNGLFADYAAEHTNFYLNDIHYLSACCGLDSWNDATAWQLYKYSPAPSHLPDLCYSVANIIKSTLGRNKKALVLDLDNTLWGGVVGDDGVEGIELGAETPTGQTFLAFQQYLKELSGLGVLLTVNSKNDYDNAIAGLTHPQSALAPGDFAVLKANWQNKDCNLAEIAHELNILPDSLVFFDDNPAERAIVADMGAGVAVPEPGQPEDYLRVLDRSGYFEVTTLSQDDLTRGEMYKANALRAQLEQQTGSYEDYLRSLNMTAEIDSFLPVYLPRIAQLTNKSNQFNLTTRRYTTAEMEAVAADPDALTLYGKLTDRFGDNGVVSVIVGQQQGDVLELTLWLMSCRVLKRGMEQAMLDALVSLAAARGVTRLLGRYLPTAKNGMVRDFYTTMGFTLLERSEDGAGLWELPIANYQPQNAIITIVRSHADAKH